ncbi:MAG: hypothetical protein V4590_01850 [Bacteroidota bacterium]
MKELIAKYIAVVLTSSVKYIFGVITALSTGLNFLETLICTVGGGMLGVIVYLYLWELILKIYRRFFPKKKTEGIRINKTKRWIVKVIVKYELYGIAFLTPLLLSVPVGVMLAAALEESKWRIKRYMFFSFLGWTLLIYAISALMHIKVDELF